MMKACCINLLIFVLFAAVNCRSFPRPYRIYDSANILQDDFEDVAMDEEHPRVRRQTSMSQSANSDGGVELSAKTVLTENDKNRLSAIGSLSNDYSGHLNSGSGGLLLESSKGHALSATGRHIPSFGDQLTGAAKVNLIHNDNHNLDANAFITRNIPKFSDVPSFNTKGGSLDYTYKDKVGAALGMSHTDFIDRTDYSALGKLNVYRGRDDSLDLYGGFQKSMSSHMPHSSWNPTGGITYTKYWGK